MQQQVSQQEQQYGSHQIPQQLPQQIPQQMMICPIQYVYDTPMLIPRAQEEQIQQNQPVLFNIQNTPPWIQNRSQNQIVYLQQVPNNYQPYLQQNMMQSPMYHPQLNYQMHHMLAQDNRQYVQIPNLTPYNTVQNQLAQTVTQQGNNEETEKMPLLTQMLNQKNNVSNVVRAPNVNNAVATVNNSTAPNVNNITTPNIINVTVPNIHNVTGANVTGHNINNIRAQNSNNNRATAINNIRPPAVNIIRPMMQNQQVQTDISANNVPRPRNGQPQLITINPMQHTQYLTENQQQNVAINITRPTIPFNMTEVPQHIRSKIPGSISVKTIYKPILPRQFRPFDVVPNSQNFYYTPNFVTVPNTPEMRNSMNTDSTQEQNNNIRVEKTPKAEEIVPALTKYPMSKKQESGIVHKRTVDATAIAKPKIDLVKIYGECNDKTSTEGNTERRPEVEPQTGEKLIRNTVYSQARGRVTEHDILQNRSSKRSINDRIEEQKASNAKSDEDANCRSSKYAKVEVTECTPQTNNISVNSIAANNSVATQQFETKTDHSDIKQTSNLTTNAENISSEASNTPESDKIINEPVSLNGHKPELQEQGVSTDLEQRDYNNSNNISPENNKESFEPKVVINRMPNFVNNNSVLKVETNSKDLKKKEDITVLTHVLDGYIIQESNVAFPIYIPKKENEKRQIEGTDDKTGSGNEAETTGEARPWRYANANVNQSTEAIKDQNKDNPFVNIQKSAVQSWTTGQLAEHLKKYEWRETASKLQEEEIDGESLLLVNKEQLIIIGVCETHADAIAAFTTAS